MYYLGWLYADGQGVPQDYVEARRWLEKGAAAGDRDSMDSLGLLYENGRGVPRNYAMAREWYEKAAAAGNAVAMRHLGVLYANGRGVPQDYAKAREWLQKALAAGDREVMTSLSWVDLLTRDYKAALDMAEGAHRLDPHNLAAEGNRAHALMFLGREADAMAIYLGYWGRPVGQSNSKLWQTAVAEDFAELRKTGLDAPLMKKVEDAFAARAKADADGKAGLGAPAKTQ